MTDKLFDPKVWGPHFWFLLMTLAVSYPLKANETTQKNIMILFQTFLYLYLILLLEINLVDY